ncbi:MAG: hypothetical protein KJ968_04760 [Nanoarchaeota archaeon]|nr:hypothetical protein [Nanoarchaeota archaeon]
MNKIQKYLTYLFIPVYIGLTVFFGYAKIWEHNQPKQKISKAVVSSIESYEYTNDLHFSSRGKEIYIQGENKPIIFPRKFWDDTVREGDTIDLVVRKGFPLFGNKLDGLIIDDYK